MQSMLRKGLDKTYLAGFSMGGHVTAAAIERYPGTWDGALPACGVIGDVELFDYFLDYNLGAAAIAGLEPDFPSPDEEWTSRTVPDIKEALSNDPDGTVGPNIFLSSSWAGGFLQLVTPTPSPLTAAGETFKDFVEIGSGGERATFDAAWNYWHGVDAPVGNFFFDLGDGHGTIANRTGVVSQNTDISYADEYGSEFASSTTEVVGVSASNRVRNSKGISPPR